MKHLLFPLFLLFLVATHAQHHSYPLEPSTSSFLPLTKNTSSWEVAMINYKSTDSILRYKKMELGLQLPPTLIERIETFLFVPTEDPTSINPFMEWDLDVEAHFTHTATGTFYQIDGYYHREYVVNQKTDDWDGIHTTHPMRIRFAPPKNGAWTAKVIVKVKGTEVFESASFEFNVTESGDKGYVSVHPNKKNLVRDGEIFFPVGHNLAGPNENSLEWGGSGSNTYLGKKLYSNRNSTKATNTLEWASHHKKMEEYFQLGGKYVRSIQSPWATLIEFEKKGNYYDRLHYAWEQDKLMDLYDKYDAMVMFNMLMHTSLTYIDGYYMIQWDWEKWELWGKDTVYNKNSDMPIYCYNTTPKEKGGRLPHESLSNEDDLRYHEQRTRYYISRYGYSTKIFEFELLSEPFNVNSNGLTKKQMYFQEDHPLQKDLFKSIETYHDRLSSYIKNHMQHTNQLIGVDYAMSTWLPYEAELKADQSLKLPLIDIVGINFYSSAFNKYLVSKSGTNNSFAPDENSRAKAISEFQRWSNKPVIFSEYGDGDGSQYCSEFKMLPIDAFSAGFTGICGYFLWDGRLWNEKFLWPTTINAQNFMNKPEVIRTLSIGNGEWIQGRQQSKTSNKRTEKYALEVQYYLSKDQNQAVGYVKNRSYNVFTNRVNEDPGCNPNLGETSSVSQLTDIKWNDPSSKNRLRVEGLMKKTSYQVEWYSYKEGKLLNTMCLKSGKSGLILQYPELKVTDPKAEQPMLYFILKHSNCND